MDDDSRTTSFTHRLQFSLFFFGFVRWNLYKKKGSRTRSSHLLLLYPLMWLHHTVIAKREEITILYCGFVSPVSGTSYYLFTWYHEEWWTSTVNLSPMQNQPTCLGLFSCLLRPEYFAINRSLFRRLSRLKKYDNCM